MGCKSTAKKGKRRNRLQTLQVLHVRIESNIRFSKHQVCAGRKSAASSPGWYGKGANKGTQAPTGHRGFSISLDLHPTREENPPKPPTDALWFRTFGMYQPPPLRARSVFDDKKVLLIDPHQRARDVRASVLRSHGIVVQTAEDLCRARSLWRPYDLILLDACGHFPGEALDFCREIKHASPHEHVVFLVGPPMYLSLTWPTEFMARETEPQQFAETVKRLFTAA